MRAARIPQEARMSVKPDRWIRKMALEHKMIEPFEDRQVREGVVTLEISNTTPLPAKIYANEGLCQVLFFESDEECEISYKDKKGKYQAQQGIVLPRL